MENSSYCEVINDAYSTFSHSHQYKTRLSLNNADWKFLFILVSKQAVWSIFRATSSCIYSSCNRRVMFISYFIYSIFNPCRGNLFYYTECKTMTFKWTRCYKVLWHLQHSHRMQRNVEPWMTFCIVLYFAYQIPQMIFKVHGLKFLSEILFLALCTIAPKISISAKSIKFFLCMKQFCLLLSSIPYCISLIMVPSIISHIFTNIFQMDHISAVKFLMSHGEKKLSFNIKLSKSLKKTNKQTNKHIIHAPIRYPALPLVHNGGFHGTPQRKPLSHRNFLIIFTPYKYKLITTIFQEKNIKYLYRFKMVAK